MNLCPVFSSSEPLFAGFALKLILNAISTGANILKGKVFRNTMINLTVANDKVKHPSPLYSIFPNLLPSCLYPLCILSPLKYYSPIVACHKHRVFPIQLFYRSIGIIRDLSGADEESARDALLRSIYRDDDITKVKFKCPPIG